MTVLFTYILPRCFKKRLVNKQVHFNETISCTLGKIYEKYTICDMTINNNSSSFWHEIRREKIKNRYSKTALFIFIVTSCKTLNQTFWSRYFCLLRTCCSLAYSIHDDWLFDKYSTTLTKFKFKKNENHVISKLNLAF